MNEELKACPFCGMQSLGAEMHKPDCFFSYLNDGEIVKAFQFWNTRPIEDALQAKLDEAERLWLEVCIERNIAVDELRSIKQEVKKQ